MRRQAGAVLGALFLAHAAAAQFTQQGSKLVGTGVVGAIAEQGYSVASSTDGTTAIVGGPWDNFGTGAVWVYTRSGGVWSQYGDRVIGWGAAGAAARGTSVAISADGNTAIVGAPGDNSNAGAAWVFTLSGGVWQQEGSKLVGTGAVGAAFQGTSVAISADGNTVIVGGFRDGSGTGAAWVFTRSRGVWSQQGGKLVGTGAVGPYGANQGRSVAISTDGNTAIVGGPGDNWQSGAGYAGAAWVFTRSRGVWSQQGSKLVGTGAFGAAGQGSSVAISADGNTAVVGGPRDNPTYAYSGVGAAWVFTRSGGVWSQQGSKLVGTGAVWDAGQGASVAISADGNTAIVGGSGDNSGVGAAWVFRRSSGVWSQPGSKLVGTGAVRGSGQGWSVAISADGKTAIVGGPSDNSNAGAAWVFVVTCSAAPSITGQPQSQSIHSGQVATLSVTASGGTVPLSYQWYQGASGDTSHPVGTNASSYTTPALTATTSYWVRVTDACGYADSATATVSVCLSISAQPQSQSVQSGQSATLSVTAAGTTPLSYQWYQGISGDTSFPVGINANSFTTPALTATTSYWVRVSNPCGHADSATARVTVVPGPVPVAWVPVASHNPGKNNSQWRSDLGLLNTSTATANVQLSFYGSGGVVSSMISVPAGRQSILTDVVGQLGGSGSGAIGVLSDQWLRVTARTYNEVSSGADCDANGTQGQDYPAVMASDGLAAGQSAYLAGLVENASYRCNIGLVNVGSDAATVLVELFNGAGAKLTDYTVSLASGQWSQATQPFLNLAGQTAMDSGYATITVQEGSGVFGFASVIDNLTNDPTTVAMQLVAQLTQQGSKLVGTGAVAGGWQGSSVAISADGNTAIVGGPNDNFGIGAAWVFTRSGGMWLQQGSKLSGSDAFEGAEQGMSVAISADGNTAIVGGPFDNMGVGAAWVFTRSGGVWAQQGSKLVGTGAVGAAEQGRSVARSADGNTAIVGGPSDLSDAGGAAWVYTRSGGVWSQQGPKLVGTGVVASAFQGWSVAISADGNTAIIGGPGDQPSDDPHHGTGAAWVFTRTGGVWSQQGSKLVGTGAVGAAEQGHSVAISADGNTAIVGGPTDNPGEEPDRGTGAAWVYTRSGGVWSQQGSKLVGTGVVQGRYGAVAVQGYSVAISADGNTTIVGGPWDNFYDGAAWVYTRSGRVWTQQGSKLVGTGGAGAEQGSSVAISADGSTAIVGGPGGSGAGAAWIFSAPRWLEVWVPVASHNGGQNNSQWRSDLGLFNTRGVAANVQLEFFGSGGVVSYARQVPPGEQSILTDVVGQFPASGSGAIEVVSDQPLKVTARTYNQVSSTASCYPDGTQGQDYPAVASSNGLVAGQSAYLAGLTENASYRCNIGMINTGTGDATVLVKLYDGEGNYLTDYTLSLAAGQWLQETQPFFYKAGETAMDSGYATITVQTGSGVFAFASVVDNITNDPTTVTMQP